MLVVQAKRPIVADGLETTMPAQRRRIKFDTHTEIRLKRPGDLHTVVAIVSGGGEVPRVLHDHPTSHCTRRHQRCRMQASSRADWAAPDGRQGRFEDGETIEGENCCTIACS